MSYSQFTKEDRICLETLLQEEYEQKKIAEKLGKSPSSISREIGRNLDDDGVYRAACAHKRALKKQALRNEKRNKIKNNRELAEYIEAKLKRYWSPEQISGRLKREKSVIGTIHHETIYQWIYETRPDLKKYLRCQKGKYRRKRGTKEREKRRNELKKKRIDTRPPIIEKRKEVGHWEGDTVIGRDKKHAIVTQVERKSGYLIAEKIDGRDAIRTRNAIIKRMKKIPKKKRKSETFDNGVEFSDYETIEQCIGLEIYFAYPYHSWERGTNENTNGLIRQFIPKSTNFILISQRDIKKAEQLINHRPRKRLGYLTPHEVFIDNCTLN